MIIITGRVIVADANRDAFLELANTQITNSLTEPGCLGYACHEDIRERGAFVFVERWRDPEAVAIHFAKDYCLAFMEGAKKLTTGDTEIEIHHVSSTDVRKVANN